MILGIDPKVDYAFKHLLGRDSTRPILIAVIDSVLDPGPGHQIQNVELLNPFNPKETLDDKLSILDIWLYFLRHAETMDVGALPVQLQQPLVLKAMEELKMLTQSDIERERYESRRKFQLDYNTGLKMARMEGRAEAEINEIRFFEQLLNRPQTSLEQLAKLPLEDLTRVLEELREELLQQQRSMAQK